MVILLRLVLLMVLTVTEGVAGGSGGSGNVIVVFGGGTECLEWLANHDRGRVMVVSSP